MALTVSVSTGSVPLRRPPPQERRRPVLSTMTASRPSQPDRKDAPTATFDAYDVLRGRVDDATVRHAVEGGL